MKVIGITGGVGSGKSEVLKFLEQEYGAVVCQMDEVAKQIQKKGTWAFSRIVQEFGEQIVGAGMAALCMEIRVGGGTV